jgi:hypothetical protein
LRTAAIMASLLGMWVICVEGETMFLIRFETKPESRTLASYPN